MPTGWTAATSCGSSEPVVQPTSAQSLQTAAFGPIPPDLLLKKRS